MKKFIYIFIFIIILVGALQGFKYFKARSDNPQKGSATNIKSYQDITSEQLYEMLKYKDFYFVNVHIPYEGEIGQTDAFIPYDEIDKNLDKLPQDKDAKIVLYCRSGRMSAIAAEKLVSLGYTHVYNHLLGMHDWQSKGYSLKDK